MIIFRLLGRSPCYEIRMSGKGTLNLDKIIEIFLHQKYPDMIDAYAKISKLSEDKREEVFKTNPEIKGKLEKFQGEKDMFVEVMRKVKYIHNGKMITIEEEIQISDESQDYLICVFPQPGLANVSSFVEKFFKEKGKVKTVKKNDLDNNDLVGPLELKVSEPEVLSEEKKKQRLEDFKKKIEDKMFGQLLHIYLEKPELIPALLAYVESGDIISKDNKDPEDVEEIPDSKYVTELEVLKQLELPFSDVKIMIALKSYEGNVDMALRHLLCLHNEKKEESQDQPEGKLTDVN